MRRRRTAAPSLDTAETALADIAATENELLTGSSSADEMSDTDTAATISTTPISDTESVGSVDEPAATPAKPRRTRRPKAVAAAEGSAETPVDTAPPAEEVPAALSEPEPVAETPKRTRRPRRTASGPDAAPVALPVEVAEPDTDNAGETPQPADPALNDLLAESEAILEQVISESVPSDKSPRNRRSNRRGRGQGRSAGTEAADTATAGTAAESTDGRVLRKRGPRVLARTMPLPALPVSEITEAVVSEPPAALPARKRGERVARTTRRILTQDGAVVVSEAQAAALLGSVLFVPNAAGEPVPAVSASVPLVPKAPQYTPLPAEILQRLPEVKVSPVNGLPQLLVNGSAVLPAFLFVNTEVADEPEVAREIAVRQIKHAYASGVRLFTLLAHLPWKRKSGERRFDSIDDVFALVSENAPDALVLPRLIFSPPASWERANPDEMATFSNGETGDVSIGSDAFWNTEARDALRAVIEHIAEGENAARCIGVYLEHGEWFQPKGVGADYSAANTAAFREWLKYHYYDNEVSLRSAWYDGSVTFATAEIPSPEWFAAAASGNGTQPIFLGEREMRIADFYAYTSSITAERIVQLGAFAKQASGGRLAVAVSYGYTLEIARPNCGHYALEHVLASRDVDILTAPLSYAGRLPGGSAPLPAPVDSIHLSGKLFVAEDDTKTHLALRPTEDVYNPKIATPEGTRSVHARNVGTVLAKGCGISWMDLWGEGWLDDADTWEHLARLLRAMATLADMRRNAPNAVSAPHVAVFVDEQSLFDMSGDEEPALLPQLIGRHRDVFARAGASVGFYLLSDLLKPEFPSTARLFIFLNAFHLPVAIRTAIQSQWQNDGRTLAWLFAPGVREKGNIAELAETIGVQLRLQAWGSRTGTVVTDGRFSLTENAKGERFGEEKRVNPSLTVVDPKAQILGEYVSSGNPSLAYRKHARWQSVFIGERDLPLPLVRGLYRLAGVPIVTPDDDVVQVAGDGFAALHTSHGGGNTLYSPTRTEAAVYDVVGAEPVASAGFGARVGSDARETRLLVWASPEEISSRFEVANDVWESTAPGITQAELPAIANTFVFETSTSSQTVPPGPTGGRRSAPSEPQPTRLYPVELTVSAEDIAQFEAALAGEIALLDKEEDGGAEGEATRKKRRRRRRGGRGERSTAEGGSESEESSDEDEAGEGETDLEAADAVFALADMTQSATGFDADALLPLSFSEQADISGQQIPSIEETGGAVPFDPVADMMARLFAQPGQLGNPPSGAPASGEVESARRPTLDELLPFSEEPLIEDAPAVLEAGATESKDREGEIPPSAESETEPADTEQTPEPAVGLLESAVRGRRARNAGSGGFTTRLRRRTPTEPTSEASDPSEVESESVEMPPSQDPGGGNVTETE